MQQLKEAGRLDRIIASKAYSNIEARQLSLVAGSHGISAGLNMTIKNIRQLPLKKALLDEWENHPHSRDPRMFENHWGVVVSLCTMNAHRVRLSQLLGIDSVVRLLKSYHWSDETRHPVTGEMFSGTKTRFLGAVQSDDPYALGDLWEVDTSVREELSTVLLILLRILSKTRYNQDRNEFHILWAPQGCRSPKRITLKSTDQSWTNFLKDTTYSMIVAVIVEDSLCRRRCRRPENPEWFKSPSVLETAICVNTTLDPTPILSKYSGCNDENHWSWREDQSMWQSTWDVSDLPRGERFLTGPQTRLKVVQPLTRWHLLLEWDPIIRDIIRDLVGMKPSERRFHWELTDDDELLWDFTRTIPVHITT